MGGRNRCRLHTETRPGAQVAPPNNGSVYSPHTKMTCANENQFGSPRTTSLRSSASVSKKTKKRQKKSERWRIMAPISFECCYNNTVYSRAPVYIVIMHSEVWIPTHVMHTYTNKTRTNTRSLVFYEYSTCAYMDAIPCATLFQGFNIYPLVFRRVLCWKDIFMLLISCNHVLVFCFYTTAFFFVLVHSI